MKTLLLLKSMMPAQLLFNIFLIFALNATSMCLGTLKSLFVNKKIMRPAYFTTFLDALIAAYAVKMIASSSGLAFIAAFAMGRLFGVYLGDWFDNRLALGALEVTIYKNMEEGIALADHLRGRGFPVTTGKGFGLKGEDRLVLTIIIQRKDLPLLEEALAGEQSVNAVFNSIDKTTGKMVKRIKVQEKPAPLIKVKGPVTS
ncbi:MAG TPA: hypothetical protein VN426_13310 [Syntrophomonadaceae bacterium]|nr:hypothetical protein [Syntrophomonadaceae bacterium]